MCTASQDLRIHHFKQCKEWKERSRIEEVDQDQEKIKIKSAEKNQEKIFNLHPTIIPPTALLFMRTILTIREAE